jgi:hypothetical protein
MDSADLVNRFTYHYPKPGQAEDYEFLRDMAHEFSSAIDDIVPEGREKSLAITKLEEAVSWANAGIART